MTDSRDLALRDIPSFIVDGMFLHGQNNDPVENPYALIFQVISPENISHSTSVFPFNMNGDPHMEGAQDVISGLAWHISNNLVLNDPEILLGGYNMAVIVLNPDFEQAKLWSAWVADGIDATNSLPNRGLVATDGTKYLDLVTGEDGEVPLGLITPFEEYNVLNEQKSYTVNRFHMVGWEDDDDSES